jgi:hypothetical protein
MNISDYYKQARAWQDQKEEAERIAAQKRDEEIKAEWKLLYEMARSAFNIEPMYVYEARKGQINEYPKHIDTDTLVVFFDPSLKDKVERCEGMYVQGTIRVYFNRDINSGSWSIISYFVSDKNGGSQYYDDPRSAFLEVYNPERMVA